MTVHNRQREQMSDKKMMPVVSAVHAATGVNISESTAARWITKGVKGCVLRSWLVGNKRVTDIESVLMFVDARSFSLDGSSEPGAASV